MYKRQVTALVSSTKHALRDDQILSVAAVSWSDRAYLSAYQDWRSWLEDDRVDWVCLMSYTKDLRLFSHMVKQATPFTTSRSKLLAGIGSWILKPQEIDQQKQIAQANGADGTVMFSYGNLLKKL